MRPSILLLIVLLMYFGWINATKPEESEELKDETIGAMNVSKATVSIQLLPYPGKVIMCKLQLKYDSKFHDKDYYYNASSVTPFESDYLKYIGDKNNSCSFNYIPYRDNSLFTLGHYDALSKPWRIVGLYKANSRWDCFFDYDSDLEACEQLDIVNINLNDYMEK